jgi:hypothetical protein
MNQEAMGTSITEWLYRLVARVGEFGPYLAIELILPGGSLVALFLWLYRRSQRKA